jgi:hypothetical protein
MSGRHYEEFGLVYPAVMPKMVKVESNIPERSEDPTGTGICSRLKPTT